MSEVSQFRGEIYAHTNRVNGKIYIGQTTQGMEKRWKEHVRRSRLKKCVEYKYPFARAIRKHGPHGFDHQILSKASSKPELDNLEKVWIILLQTRAPRGYNLTAGGEGGLDHVVGDDARKRISEANTGNKYCVGRPCSEETRRKMSEKIKGRVLSSEWKSKIAEAGRGRKHSEETKAKIGLGNQGKTFSVETRAKMSAGSRGNKRCLGRKFSSETLAKMSASQNARFARERAEKNAA